MVGVLRIELRPHGPKPCTLPLCYTPKIAWEAISVLLIVRGTVFAFYVSVRNHTTRYMKMREFSL